MAKVLAFDLGETTGYCLLEFIDTYEEIRTEVLKHGTFTAVSAISECVPLVKEFPDLVVLERQAHGEFGKRSEEELNMQRFLYSVFKEVHSIRPVEWKSGRWKNISTADYFPKETKLTRHEKDAFRIAMFATERILPNVVT